MWYILVTLLNLFEESEDIKSFVSSLTDVWPDYDLYDYDENYVNLKYTLKGIKIQFNVTEDNGVIVHYNYPGYLRESKKLIDIKNENIELPNWIYLNSIDSVYEYFGLQYNENLAATDRNKIKKKRHEVKQIVINILDSMKSLKCIVDYDIENNGIHHNSCCFKIQLKKIKKKKAA